VTWRGRGRLTVDRWPGSRSGLTVRAHCPGSQPGLTGPRSSGGGPGEAAARTSPAPPRRRPRDGRSCPVPTPAVPLRSGVTSPNRRHRSVGVSRKGSKRGNTDRRPVNTKNGTEHRSWNILITHVKAPLEVVVHVTRYAISKDQSLAIDDARQCRRRGPTRQEPATEHPGRHLERPGRRGGETRRAQDRPKATWARVAYSTFRRCRRHRAARRPGRSTPTRSRARTGRSGRTPPSARRSAA
jgi:hypothetical protein